jgi:FkbM family methyltransferase
MDFENQINAVLSKSYEPKHKSLNKVFADKNNKVYVIGKNEQSQELIRRYNILGLIDDFDTSETHWNGSPIVRTSVIDPKSIIINCVTSISPVLVRNNLHAAGLYNQITISELISTENNILPLPWFVAQQREEVKENIAWWSELYGLMADEYSKKILLDVLKFRLTANPEFMNEYLVRLKDQYFEDFMDYKNEVFVDAGGFDGDTTEEFINRYPDYKKVYLFEPSINNLGAAKKRLNGRRDIDFRAVGLSSSKGTLRFNSNAGSASAVTDNEGEAISVVSLDDELKNELVSFIKMDLEGWEMKALKGAELIIKNNKPKLAIAVYHAAKDFREIPQYILKLNPHYKIYVRHYSQGWSETVMFFL